MYQTYEFDAILQEVPEKGGAYIIFPWDIRKEFGKGRLRVEAEFNGIPYTGSIVNMGLKDSEGNIQFILGVLKSIRIKLNKKQGDTIHVLIRSILEKNT